MRVVAERETTNLCVPSSSSSFSASYSTSSPAALPLFLFASSACLPAVSLSLCSYLLPPLPSFRSLFLRRAPFDYPRPSTLSFLRSPFLLPFTARSLAHSLARSSPLPPCPSYLRAHPRPAHCPPYPPLSPSVCLASSFPSFIPSPPCRSVLLLRPSRPPPVGFFYPPFASAVPRTLYLSLFLQLPRSPSPLSFFRVGLALFCPLPLRRASPRTLHPRQTPSPLFRTLFFFPFAFTLRVFPSSPPPLSPVLVPYILSSNF